MKCSDMASVDSKFEGSILAKSVVGVCGRRGPGKYSGPVLTLEPFFFEDSLGAIRASRGLNNRRKNVQVM